MTAAIASLLLCAGGWLVIRFGEERRRFNNTNLAALVLAIDLDGDQ